MIQVEILSKKMKRESKYVKINGIVDEESFYSDRYDGKRHVTLYNEEIIDKIILKCTPNDISSYFDTLDFHWEIEIWEFWFTLKFNFNDKKSTEKNSLKVEINIENEEWERPYSIKKFAEEIKRVSESNLNFGSQYYFDDEDFITNGFGLICHIEDEHLILSEIVDKNIETVEQYIRSAHLNLINNAEQDIFSVYFKFPEETKPICKQYLIYFAQFLSDLGIEAESEMKDEVDGILFRVMPKSSDDALNKIKEALDIYIYATSKDGYKIISDSNITDIAIVQWKSNILHLQSQLMLAQSLVESKNATIEMLQLSNFQYQKILGSQVEKKNEEKIAGGLIKVKDYEGNGFEVNLPAILRYLKRRFKM